MAGRARKRTERRRGSSADASRRASRGEVSPSETPLSRKARGSDVDTAPHDRDPDGGFPIVGIGSSAGGLEALEQFLKHVPKGSGMAYVLVPHLDPTHKGMLVELLQRSTSMPVAQAKDRMQVEPEHVYVIPPNRDLSLLHGRLHLLPQQMPRGLNLPIDFFFRSLAADQEDRAIGVILSGMGSDGTLGLRAIKEKAGAAFVQSLASAKFDGMPRSAIENGLADVVAPVESLPGKILAYRRHASHIGEARMPLEEKAEGSLEKVFVLLRAHTGNDFSAYKRSTICRRIERRMGLHQIGSLAHYVRFLRENPREIELLFKELLIGVTSFFRDTAAWEHLESDVMPELLARHKSGETLRAWVAGCSTGEEAYSLAIVFQEALNRLDPPKNLHLQIFATDLDRDAIDRARVGSYPENIAADVSPERLRRFFVREDHGYRVAKSIREMLVFAPQNLIMDPPFTKLDLLTCRNLLIYLSVEQQKKLIPLFHYALNPGGVLFLGSAETIGGYGSLFSPIDAKARVYRRLNLPVAAVPVEFPSTSFAKKRRGEDAGPAERARPAAPNLQPIAERVLMQRFAPVGVLCNDKGDILYISGRAGKYLEPSVGKANLNVFAMAREGLRLELSRAFTAALKQDRAVKVRGVRVGTNGGTQTVDLMVEKLSEPKELRGAVMVVVTDVAERKSHPARARRSHVSRTDDLEEDLERARAEVQTTREEMQTSQEELKSTNEELQSTNEELQSTNEELTTSKEEMQSLNEELQTVNHELQAKVDELSRSNNDMKNLLNSTEIATLFLDPEMRVRRFTAPTAKIIKLIPGDAGRPITDITSELEYPDLDEDAREVLRSLTPRERQVGTRDGRWFAVRVMPYRTLDNVIDGVVITFTDSTASRSLEVNLREQANELRQMAESLPNLVWGATPDGACDYLSLQWVEYTGVPAPEQLGFGWIQQVHRDDRARVRNAWREAIRTGTRFDAEFRIRGADGTHRWFMTRSVPIRDSSGAILRWYGTSTDVDDLKGEEELRGSGLERLAGVLEDIREGFLALNDQLAVINLNSAAERILGRIRAEVLGRKFSDAFPELGGGDLDRKLEEALRERTALSFETEVTSGPNQGHYVVRIHPLGSPEGVSLVFERQSETPVSSRPQKGRAR